MNIIIPSKNIYHKENPKIRDNSISSVKGELQSLKREQRQLFSLNWNPFSSISGTDTPNFTYSSLNYPNIEITTENITTSHSNISFKINIDSQEYLDIKSGGYLILKLSLKKSFAVGKNIDTANNSFVTEKISFENTESLSVGYYTNDTITTGGILTWVISPNPFNAPTKNIELGLNIPLAQFTQSALSWFATEIKIEVLGQALLYTNSNVSDGEGYNPISIDTNELSKDYFFTLSQNTISKYKNGKETATILASVGEYYKQSGDLAISTKKSNIAYPTWTVSPKDGITVTRLSNGFIEYAIPYFETPQAFSEIGTVKLNRGTYFYDIEFEEGAYGRIGLTALNKEYNPVFERVFINEQPNSGEITISQNDTFEFYFISDSHNESSKQFNFKIRLYNYVSKMAFEIGDRVIPMVRGADGTDAPMSRTTSGSAKPFRVCGTKIYYDGAVWQELTLQEV